MIVLCVPGIVDQQTSVVQYAPQMPELERLNLEEKLGEHYQKPILIKNDIKVRTLAEQRYGIGNKSDSFLHINIDVGVGAGVVIAGMLIEGSHFACGEIGYSILELSHLDEKHTSGHLENHVALPKFLDKIALELQCERETLTIRAVNKLYEEGNEFVVSQVDMLAKRIAFVIANATTLLDVSKVSIGGMVTELQVDLPARINKKLRYVMPYKPEVVFSELSNSALLMGACSVGTDYLLKEGVCQ